jgi:hypothetical protein
LDNNQPLTHEVMSRLDHGIALVVHSDMAVTTEDDQCALAAACVFLGVRVLLARGCPAEMIDQIASVASWPDPPRGI